MGSYAQCWLSGIYVGSSKNQVDPSLIDHFRPADKRIVRDSSAPLPLELQEWAKEVNEGDEFLVVYYEIPARLLTERLEAWGYTIENCRRAFDHAIALKLDATLRHAAEEQHGDANSLREHYETEARILREMTGERWLELIRVCAEQRLLPGMRNDFYEGPNKGTLLGYMLSEEDAWYGCPVPDHNIPLRLALQAFPDGNLVYDITDLVHSGYVEEDEDFVDQGIRTAAEEYSYRAKTLVLTEGRSDSEVLRGTMSLLYPHLVDYFSFMDFEGARAEGGASRLAALVKSFAGAGIVNRTIALFDNDTAAAVALGTLSQINIPRHIAVRTLPPLDFLNSYPTEGPTGTALANVNGSAASIELMLGADVLTDGSAGFVPVRWTGFERSLGRYQGEVTNKALIQERYREKLARAQTDARYCQEADWEGMRGVLGVIFHAFDELQGENMLSFVEGYFKQDG